MSSETQNITADYSTHTFTILSARAERTIKRLEQLSVRAQKLGLPPFTIQLGEPVYRRSPDNPQKYDHYQQLIVTGGVPKLAGWQFFAKIDHYEDGNIVKGFSGDVSDLAQYGGQSFFDRMTQCPPNCDHCKTNRQRNTTFFFRHRGTDETMQIGSTCVADFSGHKDPMLIASLAQSWPDLINEIGADPDDSFGNGPRRFAFAVLDILSASAAVVRKTGRWVPRAEDSWGLGSSGEIEHLLVTPKDFHFQVTAEDRSTAENALRWLKSDDFDNQGQVYRHNLQALARHDFISQHNVPLFASAIAAYNREQTNKTKTGDNPIPNIRLGNYEEKIDLNVVLDKIIPSENRFGVSLLYQMRDLDTNARVIWFNSGKPSFFEGDLYRIQGTVKGWEERDGVMQTKLTRVTSPEIKLIEAIKDHNHKAISKHLKAVVHINSRNAHGHTPLITATDMHRYGDDYQSLIEQLIDAGAKPDILDNDNRDRINSFDRLLLADDLKIAAKLLEDTPGLAATWTTDKMAAWGISEQATELILRTRHACLPSNTAAVRNDESEQESKSLGLA